MSTATLTSKGQLTVPKDVRDELGLAAGSKVMFVRVATGQFRLVARTGRVSDLYGILHRPGAVALSDEELAEAIAAGGASSGMAGVDADAPS